MGFLEYIEEHFTCREVSGGSNIQLDGPCPFCGEDRADLRLYIHTKKELGVCHHCGTGFNPVKFVMAHLDCTAEQALKALNGDGEPYIRTEEETPPVTLWWPLMEPIKDTPAYDYLIGRNIPEPLMAHFALRFCPVNTRAKTADGEKLYYTKNRVIIPIFDLAGHPVAWQGRDITGTAGIKYLFPPGFKAGQYLYNALAIPRHPDYLIIAEGAFDTWGWWRAGFKNTVATFGKKISDRQMDMIRHIDPKVIFMAWDSDAAWLKYEFAEAYGHRFEIRLVDLEGKDADELGTGALLKAFTDARPYDWTAKVLGALPA